jgi:hypothetical protein
MRWFNHRIAATEKCARGNGRGTRHPDVPSSACPSPGSQVGLGVSPAGAGVAAQVNRSRRSHNEVGALWWAGNVSTDPLRTTIPDHPGRGIRGVQ